MKKPADANGSSCRSGRGLGENAPPCTCDGYTPPYDRECTCDGCCVCICEDRSEKSAEACLSRHVQSQLIITRAEIRKLEYDDTKQEQVKCNSLLLQLHYRLRFCTSPSASMAAINPTLASVAVDGRTIISVLAAILKQSSTTRTSTMHSSCDPKLKACDVTESHGSESIGHRLRSLLLNQVMRSVYEPKSAAGSNGQFPFLFTLVIIDRLARFCCKGPPQENVAIRYVRQCLQQDEEQLQRAQEREAAALLSAQFDTPHSRDRASAVRAATAQSRARVHVYQPLHPLVFLQRMFGSEFMQPRH